MRISYATCVLLFLMLGTVAACSNAPATASYAKPRYTAGTLFLGGTVVDGSGGHPFVADILVIDGLIDRIGTIEPLPSDTTVDARGMVLSPGFIDTHSHHDEGLEESPEATSAISQGITTIVLGQDGQSARTIQEIRSALRDTPVAPNIASYTGHNTLRWKALGDDYQRESSAAEIAAMGQQLDREMAAGSLGLSTGLEYDPGIYSTTDEIIALAKVAASHRGRYISHMRSEDRHFDKAVLELLQIGESAGLPVQISHVKLASVDLWGQADRLIKQLEEARARGIDVSADIYPYTYWESSLSVLMPERDFSDLAAAQYALDKLAPAEGLTLTSYKPDPNLAGKNLAQIALERGDSQAQTFVDLLQLAYGESASQEKLFAEESVVGVSMTEEDIATLVRWPHTNLCSDGGSYGHPRGYGAFPRALHQYVVKRPLIALPEMIRKMTSASAAHVGLGSRGLIKTGYPADLTLLKLDQVKDHATIEDPDALSSGVVGVWVNGVRVWENGRATKAYPGRFIRRSK